MSQKELRSICVYCGSRPGDDPRFAEAAAALGTGIAQAGFRLVYGAGDVGLMGAVARAAMAAGGATFGVIPEHLLGAERGRRDLSTLVVTQDMHERKKVMFMNSDAVVTLPGGPGTLDELFEVLTWRQLGLHARPVILLNTLGYWDGLLGMIDTMVARGFAPASFRAFLTVCPTPGAAMADLSGRLG